MNVGRAYTCMMYEYIRPSRHTHRSVDTHVATESLTDKQIDSRSCDTTPADLQRIRSGPVESAALLDGLAGTRVRWVRTTSQPGDENAQQRMISASYTCTYM
eukprot:GHVU01041628.1.p2 GENE.GHVU01041628.1~~GHVU01041628.1.p2  ORF type:complete len:102 (+),score=11.60 GHVU01041628.1:132-437(+)